MPRPVTGDMPPDFEIASADGKPFRLSAHRGAPLVLYFYAEDDTKGCTLENQEFTGLLPAFGELGAIVVGVSEDSVGKHCRFRDKYAIGTVLLSDPDHVAIEAFGVWGPKVTYGHHLIGLLRSTFLIDGAGRIIADWRVTRIRGHAQKVLETTRSLLSRD